MLTAPPPLTPEQLAVITAPLEAKIFLQGPAGAGKTTAGVERLLHLMAHGVPGDSILLLVPQRTLAAPYYAALRHPGVVAGGMVNLLTIGGLAQRLLDLYWPLVAGPAGFAHPDRPPTFLTLETAQYYLARLVRPLLDQGYFEAVSLDRNRLYSQILDNLNKSAVVGFPPTEIAGRLSSAWVGEASQARLYQDAQQAALLFRQHCLEHNLLDFSLQVEVFRRRLWPEPQVREYLLANFRHLVADNLEEDPPVSHDVLAEWLPEFASALLIYDQEAGYRRFLGADPLSALALADLCGQQVAFTGSFVVSPGLQLLGERLAQQLAGPPSRRPEPGAAGQVAVDEVLAFENHRYHPQMLDWVAGQVAALVEAGQALPGEIAVLAPFLGDSLRFSLVDRLGRLGLPARSHRPSRSLREEPAAQCLLTLAALAHPDWGLALTRFDLAYALVQAIEGLDLVRAQLLAEIVYRLRAGRPSLTSFELIHPDMQARITPRLGERYETLRGWLAAYQLSPPAPLDHFMNRLFGEVLSQPGYGFHLDFAAGEVAANLVDSVRKFRLTAGDGLPPNGKPSGQEFVEMVKDGVLADQYLRSWQAQPEQAVLLSPAYTFLLTNRPVDYQFWLDVGSQSWFERLYQPLTHPYVLSRHWPPGAVWTDEDEYAASQEALSRLVLGLVRRCRRKIFLPMSDLNEQGYEQQGPFLKAIQRTLRSLSHAS